uniref:Auxin-responsive protein n=1 Tax=Araucaria cunninghamii TaxID=56994 RepID=A0A0D6QSV7_ARACU
MEKLQHLEGEGSLDLMETELRLGLPGVAATPAGDRSGKRRLSHESMEESPKSSENGGTSSAQKSGVSNQGQVSADSTANDVEIAPLPKAQIVGWPPVRTFRKATLATTTTSKLPEERAAAAYSALYVKVSMDGAPYLRKVDLKMYSSYEELSSALEKMFSCFTMGRCGSDGPRESRLMDLLNGSEYAPTYEDKDGDWMLVGDVPWEMFVDSCKRIRIEKASEAVGFAPRTIENSGRFVGNEGR